MKYYYITLPHKTDRQETIEQSFKSYGPSSAKLEKVEAVDTNFIKQNKIEGKVTEVERAVFCSHMGALTRGANEDSHIAIFEDDTIFYKHTFNMFDDIAKKLGEDNWDIIYGDLTIRIPNQMMSLLTMQRDLKSKGQFIVNNVKELPLFCGAMSYVVNKKFVKPLLEMNENSTSIDLAYDEFLRVLTEQGKARAFFVFPFITHMSDLGNFSQVQQGDEKLYTDFLWGSLRRLCWAGRTDEDVDNLNKLLNVSSEGFAVGRFMSTIMGYGQRG